MKELTSNSGSELRLYSQVREIILDARKNSYRSVNASMIAAYWQIGRRIVEYEQNGETRASYGDSCLENLSGRLACEFGKGFDVRNLRNMRKFYLLFPERSTLRPELSWTHYRALLRVGSADARNWYIRESIRSQWSSRQLDRQVSTHYYDRLLLSRDRKAVREEADEKLASVAPAEFVKDPYIIEFLGFKDYPALRESDLEKALIDNLQSFLLELGRGFCFVARQKLMRYEDEDFFIDLVFYHSILKCHVLVDLKIGKLTHGDVGQMDSYIRMYDALLKNPDDNPTIGIILCSEPNETIARYSVLNDKKQVFASKYLLTLPSEEELQSYIENQRKLLEMPAGAQAGSSGEED